MLCRGLCTYLRVPLTNITCRHGTRVINDKENVHNTSAKQCTVPTRVGVWYRKLSHECPVGTSASVITSISHEHVVCNCILSPDYTTLALSTTVKYRTLHHFRTGPGQFGHFSLLGLSIKLLCSGHLILCSYHFITGPGKLGCFNQLMLIRGSMFHCSL